MFKWLSLFVLLLVSPAFGQDHPKAFITPARELVWAQMKADYEAAPSSPQTFGGRLYKLLKSNADSGTRYSDNGNWGTLMYHITGDPAYVTLAWTKINSQFIPRSEVCGNSGLSGNFSREYFWQYAWMYDWLYTGLTAEQRTSFLNKINAMASCINAGTYGLGGDSDQTTGDYFGMALWYALTGSYNATATTIWEEEWRKLGGFTPTNADYTTYRNSIYRYVVEQSVGGEWTEGYAYNMGTVKLILLGVDGLRTVLGVDYFPEVDSFTEEAAAQYIHTLIPGAANLATSQPYLWGDTQTPRTYNAYYYYETALVIAGLAQGTTNGARLNDWVATKEATVSLSILDPWARAFLVFNPYDTRENFTTSPLTKVATGVGMVNSRTGWAAGDSWFMTHYPPPWLVDHPVAYFGEFQLWKDGTWAFTHPQCYGGPCIDGRGSNGLTIAGVPAWIYYPREYRKLQHYKRETENANFMYTLGTQGGSIVKENYFAMPTTFFMEHTRALLWLPDWDVIVAHDRTNAKTPTYPNITALRTWMQSRPRKELYIHSPVSPTQESNYVGWEYSPGKFARVTYLLPEDPVVTIENEATTWVTGYYSTGTMAASEKKFHTIVKPSSDQQWDTFLTVWDAYGITAPTTTTLIQDTSAQVNAVLLSKSDTGYLISFNAIQGADVPERLLVAGFGFYTGEAATILDTVHYRSTGFELTFTNPGTTKAVLTDLDVNTTWEYTINGGATQDLTVDSDGIGIIPISTAGNVTLTVIAGGVIPPIIQTSALSAGKVGQAYSVTLTALHGTGEPYTWSITSGTPQAGLSLSAAGIISGTPTVAGTEDITVRACDAVNNCAFRDFTLTVVDVPSIASSTIDEGTVNASYSFQLTVVGGNSPYTWEVTEGTLPSGLELVGDTITGYPTTVGSSIFTVQVTDDTSETDTQELELVVNAGLPSIDIIGITSQSNTILYYGVAGLSRNDSCTVTIKEGEATITEVSSNTGPAKRAIFIPDLLPNRSYGVDITCTKAVMESRRYFTTRGLYSSQEVSYSTDWVVPEVLRGRGVAKLKLFYQEDDQPAQEEVVACTTSCTTELALLRDTKYTVWHQWLDVSDNVIASGRPHLLLLP